MFLRFLCVSVALIAALCVGVADAAPAKRKPVVSSSATRTSACPAAAFGGFYVGGHAGAINHSATRNDMDSFLFPQFIGQFSDYTASAYGFTGGAQAGYDWQFCNTLIGVAADASWSNTNAVTRINPNNPAVTEQSVRARMDWYSTIRARAGVVSGDTLFYVTGGAAFAQVKTTLTKDLIFGNGAFNDTVAFNQTRIGFAGGVGAEMRLGGNWSASAELLYLQFANSRVRLFSASNLSGNFDIESFDSAAIARLGLNYRFGGAQARDASTSDSVWTRPRGGRFDGFYLGAFASSVSGSHVRHDQDGYVSGNAEYTATNIGAGGGLQAGYDWQSGASVVGVVADASGTSLNARSRINPNSFGIPGITADQTFASRMPWMATVRGRAGLALDTALIYVTGGLAVAQIDTRISNVIAPIFGEQLETRATRLGAIGGLGVEFAPPLFGQWLGPNWTTTAEVLYARFDKNTADVPSPLAGFPFRFESNDSVWIGRAGLNYRFNAPRPASAQTPCAASRFAGAHLGVQGGGISSTSVRQDQDGYFQSNADLATGAKGATAGVSAGYDWQNCNALFGVLADVNWARNDGMTEIGPNISPFFGTLLKIDSRVGSYATLRTRSGVVAGNTLLFVTGGLALAQIETTVTGIGPGTSEINNFKNIRTGWTGGAGVAIDIANGWQANAELLYLQFKKNNVSFVSPAQLGRAVSFEENDNAFVGRVGVSYRFGARQ